MSTIPTVPIGRREAQARLEASARTVVRSWRLAVVAASCFVGMWLFLVALAVAVDRFLYVVLFAMMALASAYNVTRFLPRPREEPVPGVALSDPDAHDVRRRLEAATNVPLPDCVRLAPGPLVWIDDDGALMIGMAAAVCLDADQVAGLVEDAAVRHGVARGDVAARARRIAEGRLGRGLRGGRRRLSLRLLTRIDVVVSAFQDSVDDCIAAERGPHLETWADAHSAQQAVVEAWLFVVDGWVAPALRDGHLVAEPFSAVRRVLDAAAGMDLTDGFSTSLDPLLGPEQAATYELAVARTLVAQADDPAPVGWDEYADRVLLPAWRRDLAGGLAAITRVTGGPRPATLGTVVDVLEEGWGDALASVLAGPVDDEDALKHAHETAVSSLLVAATWLAAVESGSTVVWSWPFGPQAVLPGGQVVDVGSAAADALTAMGGLDGFRRWLTGTGIDPDAPVWLDEGSAPPSDRVVASAVANTGWRKNVVLVMSEQALRVYETSYVDAARRDVHLRMVGPEDVLQPLMERVDSGEAGAPAVEVLLRDVVHVELASIVGGMYWRLLVWTMSSRTRVFGIGAPGLVEDTLARQLGDRFVTRGLHAPPALRTLRAWTTAVLLGFGGLLVLAGPVALLSGDAAPGDALATSGLGMGMVVIVLLPGVVLSALAARRRRRLTGAGRGPGTRREL